VDALEAVVVFRPQSSLLDVIDVADADGWVEAARFLRGERQLEEVVYELPDGDTVVRGIDDHFVVVTFAAISGPGRETAERRLRDSGDSLDDATLWRWTVSEDPAERGYALRAFAATSTRTADPRVVALYSAALADRHPTVRRALLDAVGRAAWAALWPVVEQLGPEDPAPHGAYETWLPRTAPPGGAAPDGSHGDRRPRR
jgi:hypothetical protein